MTTTDPDIVSRLRAMLVEVRARAEAATPGPWQVCVGNEVQSFNAGEVVADRRETDEDASYMTGEPLREADAAFIAYFDPATVLRMVAATERLLELHGGPHECVAQLDESPYRDGWHAVVDTDVCPTLKIEAERWGWTGE